MAHVFYIADPADPTYATVWIDFLGYTVGGSGFTVVDGSLDIGDMPIEDVWLHGAGAGGTQARAEYPETIIQCSIMHRGASLDQMVADANELGTALQRDGVIVWQPDGATTPVFIDYYRSSIPAMFRGQSRAMMKLASLLKDPEGLPLRIKRHPFNRLSDVTVISAVPLTNATGGMRVRVSNPGSAPSELKLIVENPGSDLLTQVQVGVKDDPATEFADLYSFTPSSSTANGGANQWVRNWHEVLSPTLLSSLSGTYRVFASVAIDGDLYALQLRSAASDVETCGIQSDIIYLDGRAYPAGMGEVADIDLGLVDFDETGAALTLELWTRSDSDYLAIGNVVLMPASSQLVTLSSPGQRVGRYNKVVWLGTEYFLVSGSIDFTENESAIITVQNDYWETPEEVLPAGIHTWEFVGHVREPNGVRNVVGTIEIYEDGTEIEQTRLISKDGQVVTGWDGDQSKRLVHLSNGTSSYKLRVTMTAATLTGRKIRLHKIRRSFIPSVDNGESMVLDPLVGKAYIADTSGARMHPLEVEGPYVMVNGGESDLIFRFGANGIKGIYTDSDAREPLVQSGTSHGATITGILSPRTTH